MLRKRRCFRCRRTRRRAALHSHWAPAASPFSRSAPTASASASSSTVPQQRERIEASSPASAWRIVINCLGGIEMRTKITLLGLAAAAFLATTSLSSAFEDGKLLVWINGDKGYNGLQAIGDKFAEELGVEVVVEHPESVTDKFQQSAGTGDGPDIFIWAHDRYGEWAAAGLIAPVEPSAEVKDGIFDFAWDAVSFDGKIWGYPMAVEAIGLIYNKALVPTPPATFEEIPSMELPDGVKPILWDYNNTSFTFPLLMANGGFAFEKNDEGSYDATTT